MNIKVAHPNGHCKGSINITGSKSETNRLLLLQALFKGFELKNVSNSDDSQVMQKALETSSSVIDIHHAGTAMRFLTAYFSRSLKFGVVFLVQHIFVFLLVLLTNVLVNVAIPEA